MYPVPTNGSQEKEVSEVKGVSYRSIKSNSRLMEFKELHDAVLLSSLRNVPMKLKEIDPETNIRLDAFL
ncbi:hypothetical protein HZB02_03650 [Candidatus Woesearchaeota archaeon]|nr:hypothetical protein [Candidatus Woesearchaeota archaeon]